MYHKIFKPNFKCVEMKHLTMLLSITPDFDKTQMWEQINKWA